MKRTEKQSIESEFCIVSRLLDLCNSAQGCSHKKKSRQQQNAISNNKDIKEIQIQKQ